MEVELRCDLNPSRLFARWKVDPNVRIVEGNLIEVACNDCRDALRRRGEDVARVLHSFNVLGELVQTDVVKPL